MIRTLAAALAAFSLMAQTSGDDPVLKAMQDELARSSKLQLSNLERPYFIEYTLEDVTFFNASASLGALIASNSNRMRVPRLRVRVGDYNFDNSNYIYSDFLAGTRYEPEQFPLDNNYAAHRHGWWLATDRAYKGAVGMIARKRAALKNIAQQEALPDFWKAQPTNRLEPLAQPRAYDAWRERIKSISSVFGAYPMILQSHVLFNASQSNYYMVNSEGSVLRRPEPLVHVQMLASAQAPDGSYVRDSVSIPRLSEAALPNEAALREIATTVASNVRALAAAPMGENYSGPVLFEGVAGTQLLAELLGPNLAAQRRPVSDAGRAAPFVPSEFEGRMDFRFLPESMDVIDDPTQKTWNGHELLGHLDVDEEGVAAKPLTVIEKGRVKRLLLTRQPVRGFEGSNGRARMPGPFGARAAAPTNLFIKNSEAVKAAELKARFLKLLVDRDKPWGIIIRKMDFPSAASGEEVRRLAMAASQSGSVRVVSAPVLAYKVYPDGKEELVRGLRFRGLTTRSLRDAVAGSEELYPLHYLHNMAPMALVTASSYVAPVSVVGPALLFDELELEKPRDELQTPPVVPPPPLTSAAK